MKCTVERAHLAKALNRIQRIVERRNTYPILANVHVTAGNALTLRATDLDIEATDTVPATISEPGVTTVPAHLLHDLVRKMPEGSELTLESVDEDKMLIRGGRSRFNLGCLDPDSFPDLKVGNFVNSFSMKGSALAELIARTQFAISTEETRYYLNGIYLHALEVNGEPILRAVATDGHRMARADMPAPEGSIGMPGIIVPKKTVGELSRLLDGADGDVEIEVSDTKIRVVSGDMVLLSKLIEGTFPDYDRVTPKNNDKTLSADRDALIKVVDRVSTVATEKGGKAIKLTVNEGSLDLSVTNADHGTANEDMPVNSDIESLEIGFNARYLLDCLGQIRGDQVRIAFNDAGSPTLFTDPAEASSLYVLMPMRV